MSMFLTLMLLLTQHENGDLRKIKEMPIVNLKRERQTQDRGRDIHLTEMAVFTLETDDSRETSYPFDNSRQIGNTS